MRTVRKTKLSLCKCGKTFGKLDGSPIVNICYTCYTKSMDEKRRKDRIRKMGIDRGTDFNRDLEKLADFVE